MSLRYNYMQPQSKKILIVEDEQDMRQALVDELTHEGFQILEARNGKEGLESALKEHPDLILLDIVMPVMDGMTMMKKLRESENGKDIPVIMLTNLSDVEKISNALEFEIYDYLVKSNWKIEDVADRVRKKLGII